MLQYSASTTITGRVVAADREEREPAAAFCDLLVGERPERGTHVVHSEHLEERRGPVQEGVVGDHARVPEALFRLLQHLLGVQDDGPEREVGAPVALWRDELLLKEAGQLARAEARREPDGVAIACAARYRAKRAPTAAKVAR